MKIVGLTYLRETLKPIIDVIFSENKDCEIDPTKVNIPKRNQEQMLNFYCQIVTKKHNVDELIAQHAAVLSGYGYSTRDFKLTFDDFLAI